MVSGDHGSKNEIIHSGQGKEGQLWEGLRESDNIEICEKSFVSAFRVVYVMKYVLHFTHSEKNSSRLGGYYRIKPPIVCC